ncbi:MAG: helix-turn-helix domain-containing protein [Oscillospiraceae bacterium]|jgi:transcriptional regulator with XRE-family HTH domain|nr:helix-turn-helix domain-containing protein [Oscillospiraceae bacterium]
MTINDRVFAKLGNKRGESARLARHLGVGSEIVANWKNRKTDPPAKYVLGISAFLGVSPTWLLTGAETPSGVSQVAHGSNIAQAATGIALTLSGSEHPLSIEETELLRIYAGLGAKKRVQMMTQAFSLEDGE